MEDGADPPPGALSTRLDALAAQNAAMAEHVRALRKRVGQARRRSLLLMTRTQQNLRFPLLAVVENDQAGMTDDLAALRGRLAAANARVLAAQASDPDVAYAIVFNAPMYAGRQCGYNS